MSAEIKTRCNIAVTIKEYIVSLDSKVKNIKVFTEPLRMGAFDATQGMSRRIFDEGKKTDGSELTPGYSEKPIYINPDTLKKMSVPGNIGVPMGKPKGKKKRGETVFKTGEAHKTKYLQGGYKELRNKIGRQTEHVDLKLSGELRMDFNNDSEIAEPRKINELEYQIRLDKPINQDKRGGMEKKYGEIFTLSEGEKEHFFEVVGFEFRKALSK
jgi:hypothetical protein